MINEEKIRKLSNNQAKIVSSLKLKKYRYLHNLFLVEGKKLCEELLNYSPDLIKYFVVPDKIEDDIEHLIEHILVQKFDIYRIENKKFKTLSDTKTPQQILAVASIKPQFFELKSPIIVLDNLQDPGNLGTIIRTVDWFGFKQLVLNNNCVDIFNPKVIRSTMGSIFRVNYFISNNLKDFLLTRLDNFKIIGTSLDAPKFLGDYKFPKNFAIVIGNESQGISEEIKEICTDTFKIKGYGNAESLNASAACSIILWEISKNLY